MQRSLERKSSPIQELGLKSESDRIRNTKLDNRLTVSIYLKSTYRETERPNVRGGSGIQTSCFMQIPVIEGEFVVHSVSTSNEIILKNVQLSWQARTFILCFESLALTKMIKLSNFHKY